MSSLLALLGCVAGVACAQPAGYRVAGVVVNAITGTPVGGARVSISRDKEPEREVTVVTRGTGEFVFDALGAGKYRLVARARGYPVQRYGQQGVWFGVSIVTGPEEDTSGIVFRLAPSAAISGRVLDEAGEPVRWARVQLFVSTVLGGRRRAVLRLWRWTNDAGDYRFPELEPGTYYVAATGQPWYADSGDDRLRNASYPMVWYPNAGDVRAAAALVLKPGQEATADFTLTAVTGGALTVELDDEKKQSAAVLFTPGLPGAEPVYRTLTSCGPCRFDSVAPGRYVLRIAGATREIDMPAADLDVKIPAPVLPAVSGVVQVEGGKEPLLSKLLAGLRDYAANRQFVRAVKQDGSFSIPSVPPGTYRLFLSGTWECYLKGATAENAKLRGRTITIADGPPVKLVMTGGTDGGMVEGKVYRDSKPLPGALAILAPREASPDEEDYRGFQTDSDGSFEWEGVPAGDYILVALEDGAQLEYANREAIAALLTTGQAVRVEPRTKLRVRVDVYKSPGS